MKTNTCTEYNCTNPRIPGQRVCASCHAAYMRDYRRTTREKLVNRARNEGYEAVIGKLKAMGRADVADTLGGFHALTFPSRREVA